MAPGGSGAGYRGPWALLGVSWHVLGVSLGSPGMSLGSPGGSGAGSGWIFHGFPWFSMDFLGFSWISMDSWGGRLQVCRTVNWNIGSYYPLIYNALSSKVPIRNQKGYSLAPGTYTTRSENRFAAWWPLGGPADDGKRSSAMDVAWGAGGIYL